MEKKTIIKICIALIFLVGIFVFSYGLLTKNSPQQNNVNNPQEIQSGDSNNGILDSSSGGGTNREGLANPRVKILNASGSEIISLDHNGTIYGRRLTIDNNISAGDTINSTKGFFSQLGSSISRILNGWFTNLDVSNNVTIGNVLQTSIVSVSSSGSLTAFDINPTLSTYQLSGGFGLGDGGITIDAGGNLWVDGNITLGNGTVLTASGTTYNGSVFPETDNIYDLGSSAKRWRYGFFGTDVQVNQSLNVNEGLLYADGTADRIGVKTLTPAYTFEVNGTGSFLTELYVNGRDTFRWLYNQTAPANTYTDTKITDLNTSTYASFIKKSGDNPNGTYDFNGGWMGGGLSITGGNLYAQTGFFYNVTGLNASLININTSLLPTGFDNQFDIGNASWRWRKGYFGTEVIINGLNVSTWLYNQTIMSNIFNQNLNTTSNVVFANITSTGNLTISGNATFLDSVGIGTATPVGKLQVKGGQFSTSATSLTGTVIDSSGVTAGSGSYGSGLEFTKLGSSSVKKAGIIPIQTNADDDVVGLAFLVSQSGTALDPVVEYMRILSGGNVGIGTTNPLATLHINSSSGVYPFKIENASNFQLFNVSNIGRVDISGSGGLLAVRYSPNNRVITLDPGSLDVNANGNLFINRYSNSVILAGAGKVMVGTPNPPASTLTVNSSGGIGAFHVFNTTNVNLFFINASTGKVGIGTAQPSTTLEVRGIVNVTNSSGGGHLSEIDLSKGRIFYNNTDGSLNIWG